MEQSKRKELQLTAAKARLLGVQMVHDAASGHPGGSMSCMDVLTYLYFAEMHVDPKNPHDPERDRFVMSKGHCSPAVYPVLALRGFFPVDDLKMFRRKEAEQTKGQPTMILAKTIKGKGVSFMENNAGWHGKAPNDEQWAQAKAELEAQIKELEG